MDVLDVLTPKLRGLSQPPQVTQIKYTAVGAERTITVSNAGCGAGCTTPSAVSVGVSSSVTVGSFGVFRVFFVAGPAPI